MGEGECQCCSRLRELELRVTALSSELRVLRETSYRREGKRGEVECSDVLLGDTLLLDLSETEKGVATGVGEQLQRLGARLG